MSLIGLFGQGCAATGSGSHEARSGSEASEPVSNFHGVSSF